MKSIPVFILLIVLVMAGCSTSDKSGSEPTVVPPTATLAPAVEPTAVPLTDTLEPVLEPTAVPPTGTPAPVVEPTAVPPTETPEPVLEPTAVPPIDTPTPDQVPAAPEPELPAGVISGVVRDDAGSVGGATVRVRLTDNKTTAAADGSFILSDLDMTEPVSVTAWAEGYFVGWANGTPGWVPITITLKPHYTTDNLDYEWFSFQGLEGAESCGLCHPSYAEWQADAHSQSAVNPRFLTMYEGTDVHGNKSPSSYDASGRPQPPDLTQPYYGPGYRIDYPDRTGNCATCHTPLASNLPLDNTCGWSGCHKEVTASLSEQVPFGVSPTDLTGVAAEGVACEFCHKIGDVILDPHTGLPYAARPGISSMRLYRPEEGQQLFFGPIDDVTRRVTYSAIEEQSAFCAPCHFGVFGGVASKYDVAGGVVIYNSYGEWLESPYSDPETGQTCQDCHMLPLDVDFFVYPEQGGLRRDYLTIHSHYMPGAKDEALLQNAVTMTTTARLEGDEVLVDVSITNDKTGHHVPTGVPLRHLILVVRATDADGQALPLQRGPVLPDWTGDYAGLPGKGYAKILEDEWTGESPTAAYWRDIRLVSDTRISAFATDASAYAFGAPDDGEITVEARLVFRRAFQQLMEWKGWEDPDILMEEAAVVLSRRE